MNERVYLDHNATTPLHPAVLAAMLPYLTERFGNPSSIHAFGRQARAGLDEARARVAGLIGARPEEIVFTSGGTEADHLALHGVAAARGGGHVVTSAVEHPAVLRSCAALERAGCAVSYLPVDGEGRVDPDAVARALRPDTILVSVMHANPEVGTVQPIAEIGRRVRARGVTFHVDAVQSFGKLPIKVDELGVDLLSFSGHKIYGPKGIGGLYVRRGTRMQALLPGGAQERRRRAGTENVAGIVGLGRAAELRGEEMTAEADRLAALRERLWAGLRARVHEIRLTGHPVERLPGTCSVAVRHVDAEALVLGLDLEGIAVSSGSACSSGSVEPSHVLAAMGLSADWALGSIRCSLGRGTTAAEVDRTVEAFAALCARLRAELPAPR
jgi:cysteine desulfurase